LHRLFRNRLAGHQIAHDLLIAGAKPLERHRDDLAILEKRDLAVYFADELGPHRTATRVSPRSLS
jgi:hypothetical protein